jgi:hypothetical protein
MAFSFAPWFRVLPIAAAAVAAFAPRVCAQDINVVIAGLR